MPTGTPVPSPAAALPRQVSAPPQWRAVDFISDLHLQASQYATFKAWQGYMARTPADALFILGDLFEVWVGDDMASAPADPQTDFVRQCQAVLQATEQRLPVYFIHGNRDFLLGQTFAKAAGMSLLQDPCVLEFDQQRWLLSHGDELCLGDVDYQQFRQHVRSGTWQQDFLAKPLSERQAIAQALRAQSTSRKSSGVSYADVDETLALQWLQQAQASTLIHGHTHRPADHQLGSSHGRSLRRLVLIDWDAEATPPRLQVLRLSKNTPPERLRLPAPAVF